MSVCSGPSWTKKRQQFHFRIVVRVWGLPAEKAGLYNLLLNAITQLKRRINTIQRGTTVPRHDFFNNFILLFAALHDERPDSSFSCSDLFSSFSVRNRGVGADGMPFSPTVLHVRFQLVWAKANDIVVNIDQGSSEGRETSASVNSCISSAVARPVAFTTGQPVKCSTHTSRNRLPLFAVGNSPAESVENNSNELLCETNKKV